MGPREHVLGPRQLTKDRSGWYDPYRVSADAYYLDSANRMKYPVLRDTARVPVSAKFGAPNKFTVIDAKKKVALWAKFNAPAAGVDKIELYLPGVSLPFEGVPVTP
jgi:hypothetical protein